MFIGLFGTNNVLPSSTSEKKVKELHPSKVGMKEKSYPQSQHFGCMEHFFMSGFYICSVWYHFILMFPPTVRKVHIEYNLQRPALAPAGPGVVVFVILYSFHCKKKCMLASIPKRITDFRRTPDVAL